MKIAIILAAAAGIALSTSCGSKPDAKVPAPPMVDVPTK